MATITLAEAIRTGQYGNAPGQTIQIETPGQAAPPTDTASIIASFFGRQAPTSAPTQAPGVSPQTTQRPPTRTPPDLPDPAENPLLLGNAALKGLDTASAIKNVLSRPSIAAGVGGVGSGVKLAGAAAGLAGDPDLAKALSIAGSGIDIGKSVLGGALKTGAGALSLASGITGVVPGVLNAAGVKIDPALNAGISIGSSGLSLGSAIATQIAADAAAGGAAAAGTAGIAPAVGLLGPVAAIAGVALALKALGDSRNAAIEQGYLTKAKQAIAAFKADPNVQAYQQNLDRLKAGDQSAIPSIQDVISKAIITQEALAQPASGNTTALRPLIGAGFDALSATPTYRESLTGILATLDAKYGAWRGPVGSPWAEPGQEPPPAARVQGLVHQYNAPPLPDTPPANAVYVLPRGQTENAPAVPDPNAEQRTSQVGPGQFSTMWVDRRTGRPYPSGTLTDTSGRPLVPWTPPTT